MAHSRLCSIPGCGKPVKGRGWCSIHYQRWRRNGDPLICLTHEGEPGRFLSEIATLYEGDDCLIWPYSKTSQGYGQIWRNGRLAIVNRLICEQIYGAPPTPAHEAAHSCGQGHLGCCNPKHLRWASPKENQADRIAHGTHYRGEAHCHSRLTEAEVREIRALKGKASLPDIARRFNVAVPTIHHIHSRRTWAWLE